MYRGAGRRILTMAAGCFVLPASCRAEEPAEIYYNDTGGDLLHKDLRPCCSPGLAQPFYPLILFMEKLASYLSLPPSMSMSMSLSPCLSASLPLCLSPSVSHSASPSLSLSLCLSACPSLCLWPPPLWCGLLEEVFVGADTLEQHPHIAPRLLAEGCADYFDDLSCGDGAERAALPQ